MKRTFRPFSKYFRTFLINYFIYPFYDEKRLSFNKNKSEENKIKRLRGQLSPEERLEIKKLTPLFTKIALFLKRTQDKKYSYIKNKVYFVFMYSEVEQYFFKCYKKILMIESMTEIDAEKKTLRVMMGSHWIKIFENFKNLREINHNIDNNLVEKLNDFKVIRNLFAHGDGTITEIYLRRITNSSLKFGEKLNLTSDLVSKYINISINILGKFDNALLQKYPELKFEI